MKAAIAIVALVLATSAHADPYQFVGFTSETFLGDVGVFPMSQGCQVDFVVERILEHREAASGRGRLLRLGGLIVRPQAIEDGVHVDVVVRPETPSLHAAGHDEGLTSYVAGQGG